MGKQTRGAGAVCALLALSGLMGCGKVTEPLQDKNTNWLKVCAQDQACGEGLQCLCGVCTRACEESSDCERVASNASCHAVTGAALQSRCEVHAPNAAAAICSAGCSSDGECEASVGSDASCEAGVCVRTAHASSTRTEIEAGAGLEGPPEAAAFEAFVADHRSCESVADCTLIMPGCPLGCYVAVNAASAAEAEQVAETVHGQLRSCTYMCMPPPALACEDARCVTRETMPGWTKLPAPALSGRVASLVATVGDTIVVAGGSDWLCPPVAQCMPPDTPPFADGAAYDLSVGRWRDIADAPVGLWGAATAVVGEDVYALSQCDPGPTCPAGRALLRYRSGADEWDRLPGPEEAGQYRLMGIADGFVAYRSSDEQGSGSMPDYRFLAGEDRWVALPDDPLPPVYDRFVVEYEGRFMLFGTPRGGADNDTKLAAVYDPETGAWEELAASETRGYQVWRAGSLLYLNPHFGSGGGGIYDPSTDVWRPLPDPPFHDMAGIIGDDEASYEYASGWVLDTRTGEWLEIEPRPGTGEIDDEVVAEGPNQAMVVFGGQAWANGVGQLAHDLWLWTPPLATRSSR